MKAKKKYKTYYLHTIGGQPAHYVKGEQLYFVSSSLKIPQHLVKSLRQIKKEQIESCKRRKGWGWKKEPDLGYGYIIVHLSQ